MRVLVLLALALGACRTMPRKAEAPRVDARVALPTAHVRTAARALSLCTEMRCDAAVVLPTAHARGTAQ